MSAKDTPTNTTASLCADPAYTTEPEGRSAHEAGKEYRDCPYIRGEDRFAWQRGWIAAEVEQRRRVVAMP